MNAAATTAMREDAGESRLLTYSRLLLAVTAACLPLYAARWHLGPLPTTLLENLILVTIAVYLVARWREGKLAFHRTPLDIAIALLLIAGAIAIFVAADHRAALGLYRAYFVEPIAIFYVASDLLARRADLRTLLIGLGIGTSIFAVLNIGNFFIALAQHAIHFGAPPIAIYTSSNEVAMFLEPPFAMATAITLLSDDQRDRRLALVWSLILFVALVLTFSRGAAIALTVYALLTIVTVKPELRIPLLVIAAIIVVAVVLVLVLGANTPLIKTRFSTVALRFTFQTRSVIYGATLQTLLLHPLFGVGLGGYTFISHHTPLIYPHDMWLAFWAEVGLLGVLAFAFIFFRLLIRGWRALGKAQGFERAVLWGAVGALILWGTHGFFDSPYWKNDMSTEFWIVAALELAVLRLVAGSVKSANLTPIVGQR